jgi:acetyl esterase/lipase
MVAPSHRVPLWDGRAPLTLAGPSAGPSESADAHLDIYQPRAAGVDSSGTAVVIVPGGAYNPPNYKWAKTHEGAHVARWLVSLGVLAAVLTYRLPQGRPQVPVADALRAIETVRQRSEAWAFKALRVGVIGFSAGGHLAATAATLFTAKANRPDFAMLMCPRMPTCLKRRRLALTRRASRALAAIR